MLVILMLIVLGLSMMSVFVISVNAPSVTTPPVLEWIQPNGKADHAKLYYNPEWLKVRTQTHVSHDTWIHVLGKDTLNLDVEAKAFIPTCTPPQAVFPLIDVHSGESVTFARITHVYQQGGEHCNSFEIHTLPAPREDWLGTYHAGGVGYLPQIDSDDFPMEPRNPDQLKILINWVDKDGDLLPDPDEFPNLPTEDSTIIIKGLDERGNVLETSVLIPAGSTIVPFTVVHTWSTVCTVWGGTIGYSYYIFTEPEPQKPMLKYKIAVDHIEVTADPKNILADGKMNTTIIITLKDIDGHELHWTRPSDELIAPPVEINVAASGGKVKPSLAIEIEGCHTNATTTLISDTNARIVKVSALALIPEVRDKYGSILHEKMQLTDYTYVGFDGLNSVPYRIKYNVLDIGVLTGERTNYVVRLRLDKGCNLISIPVVPDERLTWDMLPCAGQCLISVATYQGGVWLCYDFRAEIGDIIPIVDGCGYWVKAEKPCTLVISGTTMDQYDPDTGFGLPPIYPMAMGWNLAGVTSTTPIDTADYLESLKNLGLGEKLWGPVWVYREGRWYRNPSKLSPTEGLWLFTYDGLLAP